VAPEARTGCLFGGTQLYLWQATITRKNAGCARGLPSSGTTGTSADRGAVAACHLRLGSPASRFSTCMPLLILHLRSLREQGQCTDVLHMCCACARRRAVLANRHKILNLDKVSGHPRHAGTRVAVCTQLIRCQCNGGKSAPGPHCRRRSSRPAGTPSAAPSLPAARGCEPVRPGRLHVGSCRQGGL